VYCSSADATDLDTVFAALSHRHRREIVDLLARQPASIQQLARQIGISLPAIHRHLAVLEEASLIQRRKSGRVNFLAIRRAGLHRVRDWALQYRSDWGTDEEPGQLHRRDPARRPAEGPAPEGVAR